MAGLSGMFTLMRNCSTVFLSGSITILIFPKSLCNTIWTKQNTHVGQVPNLAQELLGLRQRAGLTWRGEGSSACVDGDVVPLWVPEWEGGFTIRRKGGGPPGHQAPVGQLCP